jgi:hypothetical protein
MKFSIQREAFLKPLQQVIGVVERRQSLPVLGNVLVTTTAGTQAAGYLPHLAGRSAAGYLGKK